MILLMADHFPVVGGRADNFCRASTRQCRARRSMGVALTPDTSPHDLPGEQVYEELLLLRIAVNFLDYSPKAVDVLLPKCPPIVEVRLLTKRIGQINTAY